MKKTIFDRRLPDEDIEILNDGGPVDEEEKRLLKLLRERNTEIFEPNDRELETPSAGEIDKLMNKTASFRPRRRAFPWRILALAASVLIVSGVALFTMRSGGGRGEAPAAPPRLALRSAAVAATAAPDKADEKKAPLAYLADVQGMVSLRRRGRADAPAGEREVLYGGDIVTLYPAAAAKMIYEDTFFEIRGVGRYRVQAPDPVAADEATAPPKVLFTTRGPSGTGGPRFVIPPRTMLAEQVTPTTRAKADEVRVYSPIGASFTPTPEVRIAGDPAQLYEVCVIDVEGRPVGRSVKMRGGTSAPWKSFADAPLAEDENYRLVVRHNGRIVNDREGSSFWRLSGTGRERLTAALRRIDTIRTGSTRMFFRANAFYQHGCYAEAYAIAENLAAKEPGNTLYANLKNLTGRALRIK